MKTKAKIFWALLLAAIVNLMNTVGVFMCGFTDGWSKWKDLAYFGVTTAFIWFWLVMLVLLDEQIRKNKLSDARQAAAKK